MDFTKMHGLGNDYVYVNCLENEIKDPVGLSIKISDRHFGVGADGLILICPSEKADFFMDMYNADGSRGKMCGNGIRCVAKFVYDKGLTKKTTLFIETLSGVKELLLNVQNGKVKSVKVNMGKPILKPGEIPVLLEGDSIINKNVNIGGHEYKISCVSMGNPHAVVFVPDVDYIDIEKMGREFEKNAIFPEGVNTEFVQVIDRNTLKMRVWERGSGETLACGTGSCAVLVAAVLCNVADRKAKIILKGGVLENEWPEGGDVYMTGPCETVFEGTIFYE